MMTDPISDMLTRIRNANRIERPLVDMDSTNFKVNVAKVLKDEGFIIDYQVGTMQKMLTVQRFCILKLISINRILFFGYFLSMVLKAKKSSGILSAVVNLVEGFIAEATS